MSGSTGRPYFLDLRCQLLRAPSWGLAQAAGGHPARPARAFLRGRRFRRTCSSPPSSRPAICLPQLRELGFDAVTHYVFFARVEGASCCRDYAHPGGPAPPPPSGSAFSRLSGLPYFPSVSPGVGTRRPAAPISGPSGRANNPWSPVIVGERPGRKFQIALSRAPRASRRPLTLIASWNEWSEGHYLEPDTRFGLGWLEGGQERARGRRDREDEAATERTRGQGQIWSGPE